MIISKLQISSENYYSCEITRKIPVRVSIVAIQLPEGYGYIEPMKVGDEESLKN